MSYRVHCDWCGEHLAHGDDQAVMPVTIYHRGGGRSILDARWSEEAKVTRHFCASPKEDTDRGGRNRMGLVPSESLDSCYDRAIAAITGTKLGDPGMGMEWRLEPAGAPGQPTSTPAESATRTWKRIPRDGREQLVLDVIGEQRLTVAEVTTALRDRLGLDGSEHGYGAGVYEGNARLVMRHLLDDGRLERVGEEFGGRTRYRYFCKVDAPVVA